MYTDINKLNMYKLVNIQALKVWPGKHGIYSKPQSEILLFNEIIKIIFVLVKFFQIFNLLLF